MGSILGSKTVGLLGAAAFALAFASGATSAGADSIGHVMKGPDTTPTNGQIHWAVEATLSGDTLTVTNPQSNQVLAQNSSDGDPGIITSIDLNGPGGYQGNGGNGGGGLTANGSFTALEPFTATSASPINECSIMDYINAECDFADPNSPDTSTGIQPGQSVTITYPTNMPGYLDTVSVNFDFDNLFLTCRPSGFGSDLLFSPDFTGLGRIPETSSDNSCLPPSKVQITAMHIDTRKRTASFHQTAKGANGFGCRLSRDGTLMFDHSCGATKA